MISHDFTDLGYLNIQYFINLLSMPLLAMEPINLQHKGYIKIMVISHNVANKISSIIISHGNRALVKIIEGANIYIYIFWRSKLFLFV